MLADSPSLLYLLDEESGTTAIDRMGAINGTYSQDYELRQDPIPNIGGYSARFRGSVVASHGRVTVVANAAHEITGNLTLEAWIRPVATASTEYLIVGKYDGVNGYWMSINNGALRLHIRGGGTNNTFDAGTLVAGNPYHVCSTFSDANDRITHYVNAAQVGQTTTFTQTLGANTGMSLLIGTRSDAIPFDGLIDTVAIYASELGPARVQAHYDAGRIPLVKPDYSKIPKVGLAA